MTSTNVPTVSSPRPLERLLHNNPPVHSYNDVLPESFARLFPRVRPFACEYVVRLGHKTEIVEGRGVMNQGKSTSRSPSQMRTNLLMIPLASL